MILDIYFSYVNFYFTEFESILLGAYKFRVDLYP